MINQIVKQLEEADALYHNGQQSKLSDKEYDTLKDTLKTLDPTHPYLKKVGAKVSGKSTKHLFRMGSLDKVTTDAEMSNWLNNIPSSNFVVEHKLDGSSVALYYTSGHFSHAVTRGDGFDGEDVTKNIKHAKGFVPAISGFTGVVRCEALLLLADWKAMENPGANPRNTAAGLVRKEGTKPGLLSLFAIEVQEEKETSLTLNHLSTQYNKREWLAKNGFTLGVGLCAYTQADIDKFYTDTMNNRSSLPYEVDAIVIKINSVSTQQKLDANNDTGNPKWAVAYKFPPDKGHTIIRGVEWSVGSDGQLVPTGIFDSITLNGVTVSRASLHNWYQLNRLGLCEGDTVEVARMNDVIPQIITVVTSNNGNSLCAIPDCPDCQTPGTLNTPHVYCPNPDCNARFNKVLLNHFKKCDIKGFGPSVVTDLIDIGMIEKISDCYSSLFLKMLPIVFTQGVSLNLTTEWNNWCGRASLSEILGSIGIYGVGCRDFEQIIKSTNIKQPEDIFNLTLLDLTRVSGIGLTKANKVVSGLITHEQCIRKIIKYLDAFAKGQAFVNQLIKQQKSTPNFNNTATTARGSICFTGKMASDRSTMEKLAMQKGFTPTAKVDRTLTYLVVPDSGPYQSAKYKKALTVGCQIIIERDFYRL